LGSVNKHLDVLLEAKKIQSKSNGTFAR